MIIETLGIGDICQSKEQIQWLEGISPGAGKKDRSADGTEN